MSNSVEQILNILPLMIIAVDKSGRIQYSNRAFQDFIKRSGDSILGLTGGDTWLCTHRHDDVRGCGFGPFCTESCGIRRAFSDFMETGRVLDRNLSLTLENYAEPVYFRIRVFPQTIQLGQVVICLEDISISKKLEAERLEKEKLEVVLNTVATVSHEVNNPLAIILAEAEHLLDEDFNNPSVKNIVQQSERIADVIRRLVQLNSYETTGYSENTTRLDIGGAKQQSEKKHKSD